VAIQKSEAILLSKKDIRETSAICVFYTRDFGKIKGLIKGVRGQEAKFGLYLQEFAKYDIVYYEKKKADTYLVTQCDLKDAYTEIAEDFQRRIKAYFIIELIDKFTPLDDKSAEIYGLLGWILGLLRSRSFIDRPVIIFQIKLLDLCGFLPQLDSCVSCSAKLSKDSCFSVRLSGLLCDVCRSQDIQALLISKGAIASINMIRQYSIRQLERINITNNITKELSSLLERYISFHLGEHLKTHEFFKNVS
jgi:DNA repair protein RecO (recombination protein O)